VLFEQALGFAVLAVVSVLGTGRQPVTTVADDEAAVRSRKHLILPCRRERPVSSERNCNVV
jgi:hypothetical protein